jgi:hypothetical protein
LVLDAANKVAAFFILYTSRKLKVAKGIDDRKFEKVVGAAI